MNPSTLEPPLEAPSADYDRWFHAKVQAALDGVADGTNRLLTDEEVAAHRAALRGRLESMLSATPAGLCRDEGWDELGSAGGEL